MFFAVDMGEYLPHIQVKPNRQRRFNMDCNFPITEPMTRYDRLMLRASAARDAELLANAYYWERLAKGTADQADKDAMNEERSLCSSIQWSAFMKADAEIAARFASAKVFA